MRSLYERLVRYAVLRAILFIALGILLIVAPSAVTQTIVYVIAAYLAVMGIIHIVGAAKRKDVGLLTQYDFIFGALLVVLAVILAIFSKQIISILPIFFGVLAILGGVYYLTQAVAVRHDDTKPVWVLWVLAIFFIIVGFILVINPFQTLMVLFRVFGVVLVLYGISELITYYLYRPKKLPPK